MDLHVKPTYFLANTKFPIILETMQRIPNENASEMLISSGIWRGRRTIIGSQSKSKSVLMLNALVAS